MRVVTLLEHVRNEVLRDIAAPQLFSDDSLVNYLNEGLKQFARKTHYFIDEQTIQTVDDQRQYTLPSGTIYVRQVSIDDKFLVPYTRKFKPTSNYRRKPEAYTTDTSQSSIKLHPIPDAAYNVVIERAFTPATMNLGGEIDLPDDWALLLADWIAYKALKNNDPDGSETVAAEKFWTTWQQGVNDAKREVIQQHVGDMPYAQAGSWT